MILDDDFTQSKFWKCNKDEPKELKIKLDTSDNKSYDLEKIESVFNMLVLLMEIEQELFSN